MNLLNSFDYLTLATKIDLEEELNFIQKNPKQIRKSLIAHPGNVTDQKSVFIHWTQPGIEEQINYWIEKYSLHHQPFPLT